MLDGIGDIESSSRGTAARYNAGKPPLDLLPLYMVVETINQTEVLTADKSKQLVIGVLNSVSEFQKSGDPKFIKNAIFMCNNHWVDCANVFGYGAKKYASWNWCKGMKWSVPIACIGRHAFKIIYESEHVDIESGLPHIGHILCNLVMLNTYMHSFPEGNDLPPKDFTVNENAVL